MSEQWFHEWFPLTAMSLQSILWGLIVQRIASPKTMAILTFTRLPGDPDF